jgi:hypothetical protein
MSVFIGVSARTCMSICVCTVFLKKKTKACGALNKLAWDFAVDGSPKSKT